MRNRRFNLLPRNAICSYRQRMAQINHLIQADAKEIGCLVHRHLRKFAEMNICIGGNWEKI
jgi:hypothetical protein